MPIRFLARPEVTTTSLSATVCSLAAFTWVLFVAALFGLAACGAFGLSSVLMASGLVSVIAIAFFSYAF